MPGRHKNISPVSRLNLLEESIVHWDTYQIVDKKKTLAFLVTCGICKKDRWVRRSALKPSSFTGLCKRCALNRVIRPPKPYPGWKRQYARSVTSEGYISVVISSLSPEDQVLCENMGQKNGVSPRILEHRFVMAKKLGRPLQKNETVHHINGNKTDNRPENLELFLSRHPRGQRPDDLHSRIEYLENLLKEHDIPFRFG